MRPLCMAPPPFFFLGREKPGEVPGFRRLFVVFDLGAFDADALDALVVRLQHGDGEVFVGQHVAGRGEALVLPADTPRGEITFSFMGLPLGLAKNIGNRANNLYPKPWRIKTTHTPTEYEPILKQI